MLSLQVVSDIHLEGHPHSLGSSYFSTILKPSADVLALVGDIGSPLDSRLQDFIQYCSTNFQRVYYVHGNHELYNNQGIDANAMIHQIETLCNQFPNVVYLNNRVDIYQDVYFIGTTLWSFIPKDQRSAVTHKMNDYRHIYSKTNIRATVDDTNHEFFKNRVFLEEAIRDAHNKGYQPVVLTHHAPWTKNTSHPRYDQDPTSCAFSTDLPAKPNTIQLWACGHTHFNFDHTLAGYRLVSNQYGYHGTETVQGYNPTFSTKIVRKCVET